MLPVLGRPEDLTYRNQLAEVDLGGLVIHDKCPLNQPSEYKSFHSIALECTHHFLKLFYQLPNELVDDISITQLPKPSFKLPREKKIPKVKPLTKWDSFARLKGIKNRKKPRMVWDPKSESWKPRWGKDRIDDIKENWVLEVPDNADPYEDQFEKLSKLKNERKAKNELNRLRNVSKSFKATQASNITPTKSKYGLTRALSVAQVSDASMGRFAAPLNAKKLSDKMEKNAKNKRPLLSSATTLPKKSNKAKSKSQPKKKKSRSVTKKKTS